MERPDFIQGKRAAEAAKEPIWLGGGKCGNDAFSERAKICFKGKLRLDGHDAYAVGKREAGDAEI
ncbi:MAG: hypothetical protein NTX79_06230 [Candidatus Micrarchaeota archaeon]|nr:hypothetical protein [Candidatus Micrarchaeota archaeon]